MKNLHALKNSRLALSVCYVQNNVIVIYWVGGGGGGKKGAVLGALSSH